MTSNLSFKLVCPVAQVLLEAAAERQSEACGMAALALLSAAAAPAHTLGQLSGEQLLGPVLHVAQLLVQVRNVLLMRMACCSLMFKVRCSTRALQSAMCSNGSGSSTQHVVSHQYAHGTSMQTMVGHPAAGIRNAGFHALEDMLMALQPGTFADCAAAGQHVHNTSSHVAHVAVIMDVV